MRIHTQTTTVTLNVDRQTFGWIGDTVDRSAALPIVSNLLFKQLLDADRRAASQHAEHHSVKIGDVLFDAGEPIDHIYFPLDTMIALEQNGRIEVAVAGNEGMSGWTALAGFRDSPYRAVVRNRGGQILKVSVDTLRSASSASPSLRLMIARYMVVTAVQMAEGLGAHSHHRLDAAIARWLLMRHDRVGGDWIRAQHDEIADSIGARRASVTDCLHILEGEYLIRCRRGRILIRSRRDLEHRANGAYGAAETLYRSSLGCFGKSAVERNLQI